MKAQDQDHDQDHDHEHGDEPTGEGGGLRKGIRLRSFKTDLSIGDTFQLLRDVGFDGVELVSPMGVGKDAYLERRKELLEAQENTGLDIFCVADNYDRKYPFTDPDPMVRKRGFSSLATAITDAAIYHASVVRLTVGGVSREVRYDDAYLRTQEAVSRIVRIAEQAKVKLAVENVNNGFLLSPLELASYIDDFSHEAMAVCLNVGNVVPDGWPEQWMRILGERVALVVLTDFSHKQGNEKGLPHGFDVDLLEGDCDWGAFMKEYRKVRTDGWFTVEARKGTEEEVLDLADRVDRILAM